MNSLDEIGVLSALAAGCTTFLGGVIGLRLTQHMALLLSFTFGMISGIALLDLLPEALAVGTHSTPVLAVLAAFLGGFIFHALLKALLRAPEAGGGLYLYLAPASLTFHSILDGAGIGIAFHLTSAAGLAAAAAVIAHDLADGINTVGVSLTRGTRQVAWRWLIANSAAPLIGFLSVSRINPVPTVLSLLLAAFAGFLLHIATREILPRVLGVNPLSIWIMAFLGFASLCAFKLLVPG